MITSHNTSTMSLEQKDLEMIERVIYKNGDDVAVSISRSFERMEERIDSAESRLYARIAELEDKVEASREALSDELGGLKGEVRDLSRPQDDEPTDE